MRNPRRMLQQVADRVLLGELRQLEPTRTSVAAYHRTLSRLTRADLNFIRGQAWMRCDPDDILIWFGHDEGPRMEFAGLSSIVTASEAAPAAIPAPVISPAPTNDWVQLYRTLFPPRRPWGFYSNPGADL
ncbi:hypothetical protein [Deinococcus sp. PEB2-67]